MSFDVANVRPFAAPLCEDDRRLTSSLPALALAAARFLGLAFDTDTKAIIFSTIIIPLVGTALKSDDSNRHVFALRCLHELDVSHWEGDLDERSMGQLMKDLDSKDAIIRRLVSALLHPFWT